MWRAHALTLAVPPESGGLDVSEAVCDGVDADGVVLAVGLGDVVLLLDGGGVADAVSPAVPPSPHPAARTPTRVTATAAVRRGRTKAVGREVTPRR